MSEEYILQKGKIISDDVVSWKTIEAKKELEFGVISDGLWRIIQASSGSIIAKGGDNENHRSNEAGSGFTAEGIRLTGKDPAELF